MDLRFQHKPNRLGVRFITAARAAGGAVYLLLMKKKKKEKKERSKQKDGANFLPPRWLHPA